MRLKDSDDLGCRMKAYEAVEAARRLDAQLPIYARIDGRAFSTFTRGMQRPFDPSMTAAMIETAKYLLDATQARISYTQSDEISLVWLAEAPGSDVFFSGRVQKMVSVLASMSAARFVSVIPAEYRDRLPHFDARVFQLPSKEAAANTLLWRAMDARKNAIGTLARSRFPATTLHGKHQPAVLAMLAGAGVDFEADYPASVRLGTFIRRKLTERPLSDEELARIPQSRRPTGPVVRGHCAVLDMPPFNKVANRVGVIFDGEDPILSD